jgi:HAMP domain-containing protein
MGWLPTVVLVVVGIVLLGVLALRLSGALRRTRIAARTLNTSVTGRTRRINAGLDEVRVWRAAHRRPAPAADVSSSVSGRAEAPALGAAAGRRPAA